MAVGFIRGKWLFFHRVFVSELTRVTSALTNAAHWSLFLSHKNWGLFGFICVFFFFCRFYTLSPGIVPLSVHQLLLQFWSHCSRRCSRPIGCWLWTQGRLSRCHGYSKQEMPWSRYCFRPCSGVSPVCLRGETRLVAVAPSFPSALTMPPFLNFFFFFLQPRSWTKNPAWGKMLWPETTPETRQSPENPLSAAS